MFGTLLIAGLALLAAIAIGALLDTHDSAHAALDPRTE
jgi:hypothetical protein